jgi:hypothetical protein
MRILAIFLAIVLESRVGNGEVSYWFFRISISVLMVSVGIWLIFSMGSSASAAHWSACFSFGFFLGLVGCGVLVEMPYLMR